MEDSILPIPLGKQAIYHQMLGLFHSNWSAIDLHTDFAICKFLKVTYEQAHLITSGMMFGRKARLLADLIGHSDHPKRAAILGAFNKIRAVKRDVITHSYVASDATGVVFLERNTSGSFKVKEHSYTAREFHEQSQAFFDNCEIFIREMDVDQVELDAFVKAAFNLERKDKASPESPTESK